MFPEAGVTIEVKLAHAGAAGPFLGLRRSLQDIVEEESETVCLG